MPGRSARNDTTIVDTTETLLSLLDNLSILRRGPPSLCVDVHGSELGRHGHVSILSLFLSSNKCFLVDVKRMGPACFLVVNGQGVSIKSALESQRISKVFFDVRDCSATLFHHCGIRVARVREVQLMDYISQKAVETDVRSLTQCIETATPWNSAENGVWRETIGRVERLCADRGGWQTVVEERPIAPEIISFCTRAVAFLPGLYDMYNSKLKSFKSLQFWRSEAHMATQNRINISQRTTYCDEDRDDMNIPWDETDLEEMKSAFNSSVVDDHIAGESYVFDDDVLVLDLDITNESASDYDDDHGSD